MSNNEQPRGTKLQDFIAEEVGKVKDVYCPVKAGMLRRILITKAPIEKLHPNPDDEFCMPAIGPNMEIVSKYQREFQQLKGNKDAGMFSDITADKPLQVQKITPDG